MTQHPSTLRRGGRAREGRVSCHCTVPEVGWGGRSRAFAAEHPGDDAGNESEYNMPLQPTVFSKPSEVNGERVWECCLWLSVDWTKQLLVLHQHSWDFFYLQSVQYNSPHLCLVSLFLPCLLDPTRPQPLLSSVSVLCCMPTQSSSSLRLPIHLRFGSLPSAALCSASLPLHPRYFLFPLNSS